MTKRKIVVAMMAGLAAIGGGSSIANGGITDGLVAYFPFEGTPFDVSGHVDSTGAPYQVTVLGNPTYELGAVGQAVRLDGIDDGFLVDHEGELSFDLDSESYSLSFFALHNDFTGTQDTIIQDRYGSNHAVSYNFGYDSASGEISSNSWYGEVNNVNYIVSDNIPSPMHDWVHIAVVFDAVLGEKTLYVNGVLVDTALRPNETYDDPQNTRITIGMYWGGDGSLHNWFRGMIDDLRIYDRAITQIEVNELAALNPCPADMNGDGMLDVLDVFEFLSQFSVGCP